MAKPIIVKTDRGDLELCRETLVYVIERAETEARAYEALAKEDKLGGLEKIKQDVLSKAKGCRSFAQNLSNLMQTRH